MILSISNQQYEHTNMLLQKFSLQITIFLSDHKKFSPAVYDIKKPGTAIPCVIIINIFWLDLRKPILSMQNTPIHIMVSVSLPVCTIPNLQILLKSLTAYMVKYLLQYWLTTESYYILLKTPK